jgi:uncharacterized protein (TIGR03435 family)
MSSAMLLLFVAGAAAQPRPTFEVASIKPAKPTSIESGRAGERLGVTVDASRARFRRMSLMALIGYAYRVKSFQISGPEWASDDRFDIVATIPDGGSPEHVPEMLQALIEERFKLALHTETKEFPIYALVVGKSGPKLTPKPPDYDAAAKNATTPVTLDLYAALISVDRPVVNMTAIEGEYMLWTSELLSSRRRPSSTRSQSGEASEPSGAFQIVERFGLKLDPRKIALPHLVIDHAERAPTEN